MQLGWISFYEPLILQFLSVKLRCALTVVAQSLLFCCFFFLTQVQCYFSHELVLGFTVTCIKVKDIVHILN